MDEKPNKSKWKKVLIILVIVLIVGGGLVYFSPLIFAFSLGTFERTFESHSMDLCYPMDDSGKAMSLEEIEEEIALKGWSVRVINESDFEAYPEVKSMFMNINKSINRSDVTLSNPLSTQRVSSRERSDDIRSKFCSRTLYYEGEYYRAWMPMS